MPTTTTTAPAQGNLFTEAQLTVLAETREGCQRPDSFARDLTPQIHNIVMVTDRTTKGRRITPLMRGLILGVLLSIGTRDRYTTESAGSIANRLKCSVQTVRRALRYGCEAGLLAATPRLGRSHSYAFGVLLVAALDGFGQPDPDDNETVPRATAARGTPRYRGSPPRATAAHPPRATAAHPPALPRRAPKEKEVNNSNRRKRDDSLSNFENKDDEPPTCRKRDCDHFVDIDEHGDPYPYCPCHAFADGQCVNRSKAERDWLHNDGTCATEDCPRTVVFRGDKCYECEQAAKGLCKAPWNCENPAKPGEYCGECEARMQCNNKREELRQRCDNIYRKLNETQNQALNRQKSRIMDHFEASDYAASLEVSEELGEMITDYWAVIGETEPAYDGNTF